MVAISNDNNVKYIYARAKICFLRLFCYFFLLILSPKMGEKRHVTFLWAWGGGGGLAIMPGNKLSSCPYQGDVGL